MSASGRRLKKPDICVDGAGREEFPCVDAGAGGVTMHQERCWQGRSVALQHQSGLAMDQLPHQDDGPQGVRAGGVLGA